jgi:clan AA aspartic protease (TIGR02281 family)
VRNFLGILAAALLAVGLPASAEIYRWTDADGRVHFTQELSQVPAAHREEAVRRTIESEDPGGVSTYSTPSAPSAPAARAPRAGRATATARPKRIHRIRVERAGTGMLVAARINNGLMVPFLVDTGASDVSIPRWAAERLDLQRSGRTRQYQTANGIIEEPVVMLDSVDLAGARVDDVPASISSTMQVGLLGLSYFNHFTYHVDAAQGILTLVPNDLEESGSIRGGRSKAQWRSEYRGLGWRREQLAAAFERTSPNQSSKRRALEAQRQELDRQLEILEAEADQARVPMAWRD